jgi:hypothetical protein
MGHYCRLCGREKRNEAFSGKGHHQHVCKDCWPSRNSVEVKREQYLVDIHHRLFSQSVFSKHNAKEMDALIERTGPEWHPVSELAALVKQIGRLHPGRRSRWKWIYKKHPELFQAFKSHALNLGWWEDHFRTFDADEEGLEA